MDYCVGESIMFGRRVEVLFYPQSSNIKMKKHLKKSVEEIKKFQKKHKDYFNKINIKRTSSRSINILDFNY